MTRHDFNRRRLSALLALGLGACSPNGADQTRPKGEQVVPVTVMKVRFLEMDRAIPVSGTLCPKDEATISAAVEGQVEKTLVEVGDRVAAGQVIAEIDTTTYEALARQAEANLARAKATDGNADHNLKRTQDLQKNNIASMSDLDKAKAEADQARAEVKAAEAAEAMARLNLERSHVRAPFDAAVAERVASAGDFMKVGSILFRMVNDRVLKYMVQAPERYAGDVKIDQSIFFSVDAYPGRTFEGQVYLISPQVNTVTRGFSFGALVQNPERKLKASTFARGELVLQRKVPTPVVPLDAVINFAGITRVFVVEKGVARGRDVQVGLIKDGQQQVLAGLKPGEAVVVSGQTKLFDGSLVRVKELKDRHST